MSFKYLGSVLDQVGLVRDATGRVCRATKVVPAKADNFAAWSTLTKPFMQFGQKANPHEYILFIMNA